MNDKWALWRYGDSGWKWTAKNIDATRGQTYRTDREGRGLFRLRIDDGGQESWHQEQGTGQYSLPSERGKVIKKLARQLATVDELSTLAGKF